MEAHERNGRERCLLRPLFDKREKRWEQLDGKFKGGDKVRLRISNGGASTYFWLTYGAAENDRRGKRRQRCRTRRSG
jgi:hypothetical protein